MRTTLLGFVCLVSLTVLGGCWLFSEPSSDQVPDLSFPPPTDDPWPQSCNPLGPPGQQGCLTGQKCTWVTVQETPERLGRTACVPDGTVDLTGACSAGVPGETTGYDNCRAGLYCIAGACQDICGFDGSANAACASGFYCTRYADTFANGDDDPVAGLCNRGCNPLTQLELGSDPPTDCGAGRGCYLLTSQTETIAVCASAGTVTHGADITTTVYANSCVPGAQPRRKDETSQTSQCGGLCNVVDVHVGMNEASEGGAITASTTDKDSCQATWGAASPGDGVAGESCRYWWAREPFEAVSPYSNTVGWCFRHAAFRYDADGDMMPDTLFPRCTTLTTGDTLPPLEGTPDAQYFWCVATPPPMLAEAIRTIKRAHARREPRIDRLAPPW